MSFRDQELSTKLNLAIALPIAMTLVVGGAAYIGVGKLSEAARSAFESSALLQDANELLTTIERVDKIMTEPGSQQQVQIRLTPEILRLQDLSGTIAATLQDRNLELSKKLLADIAALDQIVLPAMLARGGLTDVLSLIPSTLSSFSEAAMRLSADLLAIGAVGSEDMANELSKRGGALVEGVAGLGVRSDPAHADQTRQALSSYADLIDQAAAMLKANGKDARSLPRALEQERSKLYGYTMQLGASAERLDTLHGKVDAVLNDARRAAAILQSENRARSVEQLADIAAWTHTMMIGALSIFGGGLAVFGIVGLIARYTVVNPLLQLAGAMMQLARGETGTKIKDTDRNDAIGAMARSVVVFRDSMIETERLRADSKLAERRAAEQRKVEIARFAQEFQAAVVSVIGIVSEASNELEAAAGSLTGIAETTQQLSTTLAHDFEHASRNTRLVASATEEMNSSITEIAKQVREASEIASVAVDQATKTDQRIIALSNAASRIGDVVRLISAIAKQTHLLALNATIEASRAGEAGRGFTIVAQEVKALATQTAGAAEDIATLIATMQSATGESVSAIKEIGDTISRLFDIASAINAAVEEQRASAREIARNVHEVASGAVVVAEKFAEVSQGASATDTASTAVLASAQLLSKESRHLNSEVEKFVATIRAA